MTAPAKPTIDEQIKEMDFIVGNIKNSGADAPKLEAILSTLRAHKAIMEAERPEPALVLWKKEDDPKHVWEWLIAPSCFPSGTKFYGPEVLAYADRMRAERDKVVERHQSIMKRNDEMYADLLRQSNVFLARAETAERQLAELQEKVKRLETEIGQLNGEIPYGN